MLGEDHPLNVSNALAGLVYYTIMMFLSKCVCAVIFEIVLWYGDWSNKLLKIGGGAIGKPFAITHAKLLKIENFFSLENISHHHFWYFQ